MRLAYTTVFSGSAGGEMRTFYRISPDLGFVPAGVSFVHRGVAYSTARILGDLLPPVDDPSSMPKLALKKSHWSGDDRQALEARFVRLTRALEDAKGRRILRSL